VVGLGALGIALKGASARGVIFETALGGITVAGTIFTAVVIAAGILVYILTRPKDQILYVTVRIIADTSTNTTTYSYNIGSAVEDSNATLHEAWFLTNGAESHISATNNSSAGAGTDTIMYASLIAESAQNTGVTTGILKGPYNLKREATTSAFS